MVRQWPEGIGRFTSYSNTYASTADFDERNPVKPVNRLMIGYGTLSATEVFRGDREADLLAAAILTLRRGEPLPASYLDEFPNISTQLSERYGDTAARVTLVLETKKFDWSSGRFVVARNDLVGTLNLGSAALEPQDEPQ